MATVRQLLEMGFSLDDIRLNRAISLRSRPDIVLFDAGVYWVWEIKPDSDAGHARGPAQLQRYVSTLLAQGYEAAAGFALPPTETVTPAGEKLTVFDGTPPQEEGLRFYSVHDDDDRHPPVVPIPIYRRREQAQVAREKAGKLFWQLTPGYGALDISRWSTVYLWLPQGF